MTTSTYILLNQKNGEKRIVRAAGKGKALKYARGQITAIKANVEEVLELIDMGVPIEVVGDAMNHQETDPRQLNLLQAKGG